MTNRRISFTWPVFVLLALGLTGVGATAAYVVGQRSVRATAMRATSSAAAPAPASAAAVPSSTPGETASLPDVTVSVSPELAQRAGLEVGSVRAAAAADHLRVPGVVEPNAYRHLVVTPLVGGRVTRVPVALGDRVRRGQTLADIYSRDLAQAHTEHLSMQADLEAAHQRLQRTRRLVEIGAASRQDLEQAEAEHTRHAAGAREARARLAILGVSDERLNAPSPGAQASATIHVPAPLSGVVTKRQANVGLVVEPTTELFSVVDLSRVWIIGSVYERDLSRLRVGSPASLTATALPGLTWEGRVGYIDPQVAPETRTVQFRVEVPNPGERLRLGMYVDVALVQAAATHAVPVVPRFAIQTVGHRHFVYLPASEHPGRFIEREVRLGRATEGEIEVLAGLNAGDVVVTKGSFLLRAERERLGLRPSGQPSAAATITRPADAAVQRHDIEITGHGFSPDRVDVKRGDRLALVFVRRTDQTCATEVVISSRHVNKPLPLNTPVTIELTPEKTGEIVFTCGMNMIRGTLVVQ